MRSESIVLDIMWVIKPFWPPYFERLNFLTHPFEVENENVDIPPPLRPHQTYEQVEHKPFRHKTNLDAWF